MQIISFHIITCLLMVFAFRANAKPIGTELVDTGDDFDSERPPIATIIKK